MNDFERVHKLAEHIKKESKAVIKDYTNNEADYEFVNGVVIGYDTILDSMEEIWDINLSDYRTDLDF